MTTLADVAVRRAVADQEAVATEEVHRLLDAAFTLAARAGNLDLRVADIVAEAGLSNVAFYRHFRSKDELLVALLDAGRRQLVGYLDHLVARADSGRDQVRAWITGVLEQARNRDAAAATRPFAVDGDRLADRFPAETTRSADLLRAPLREAVSAAGGAERDADAVYHLTMATMHDALLRREPPSDEDAEHLVEFVLAGIGARPGDEGPAHGT